MSINNVMPDLFTQLVQRTTVQEYVETPGIGLQADEGIALKPAGLQARLSFGESFMVSG